MLNIAITKSLGAVERERERELYFTKRIKNRLYIT